MRISRICTGWAKKILSRLLEGCSVPHLRRITFLSYLVESCNHTFYFITTKLAMLARHISMRPSPIPIQAPSNYYTASKNLRQIHTENTQCCPSKRKTPRCLVSSLLFRIYTLNECYFWNFSLYVLSDQTFSPQQHVVLSRCLCMCSLFCTCTTPQTCLSLLCRHDAAIFAFFFQFWTSSFFFFFYPPLWKTPLHHRETKFVFEIITLQFVLSFFFYQEWCLDFFQCGTCVKSSGETFKFGAICR